MKPINRKLKLSKNKFSEVPFRKLVPNIVTMLALCSGITSIRYSVQEDWSKAVLFIFLAALFDGLDGRLARMLKASSKFGAELDSLSDFVSFGVAPAILMFQWCLFDLPKIGWFFCLLYAMGMAMRLARFNTMLEDKTIPPYWSHYFTGVPAPAAAAMVMMPVLISFDFIEAENYLRTHLFCGLWMCIVSYLETKQNPHHFIEKNQDQRIYDYSAVDNRCPNGKLSLHTNLADPGSTDSFVHAVNPAWRPEISQRQTGISRKLRLSANRYNGKGGCGLLFFSKKTLIFKTISAIRLPPTDTPGGRLV